MEKIHAKKDSLGVELHSCHHMDGCKLYESDARDNECDSDDLIYLLEEGRCFTWQKQVLGLD